MNSIRAALRNGLIVATLAAFAAAGVATEMGVRRALLDDLDRSLRERALWVESTVELGPEGLDLGFQEFALREFEPHVGASLLNLWSPDGTRLYRSPSLGGYDLVRPRSTPGPVVLASERTPDGRHLRTYRAQFTARLDPELEQPATAPQVLISLGRDMAEVEALLRRLRLVLASVGLAAAVLMLLFVQLVVRRSLRPLERIAGEIGGLDTSQLSGRLGTASVPAEVAPVVRRINELLDRLNAAFERERTFSADIAHELRTPLAGIRTALEVELSQPRDAESYRVAIRESLTMLLQMQGLIETLLQLARLDAGLVAAESVETDVAERTRTLLRTFEPLVQRRRLRLHTSLDGRAPVRTDPTLLAAAIRNILDNAVSHATEGGDVHVEVSDAGEHARVRVRNSASGLTAADVPRLFERFVRQDDARGSAGGHYGLGLALVQRIATALHCRMDVCIAPNGEFAFTLDVPRAGPGQAHGRWPQAAARLVAVAAAVATCTAGPAAGGVRATARTVIDPARFVATVDNPYHPLAPGTTRTYVEKLGRHVSDIETIVTSETREVQGVTCLVVRELVREKGELTQQTDSWFAQDADGNVWIFGEDAREFLGRGRVNPEGSWEAGVDGAEAGIVMPAHPAPGEPFRLGYLADVAEDMAQIVAVTDSVTVPFGSFGSCVKTKEWSMLESGTDKKWYAPGIGLVRALSAAREELVLVSLRRP